MARRGIGELRAPLRAVQQREAERGLTIEATAAGRAKRHEKCCRNADRRLATGGTEGRVQWVVVLGRRVGNSAAMKAW